MHVLWIKGIFNVFTSYIPIHINRKILGKKKGLENLIISKKEDFPVSLFYTLRYGLYLIDENEIDKHKSHMECVRYVQYWNANKSYDKKYI